MELEVSGTAPTFARGFAVLCVRPERLDKFAPGRVHELASFAAHRSTVVDIACKERARECYAGDEKARQSVELKFGDFVDLYQACFADRPHWLRDVEDFEFYLCQCPVAVAKPDDTCSEPCLPAVMDDLLIPECLAGLPLGQVNLWMSTDAARTGLHYDAYQNVLVVLYGRKVVTLYPPSACSSLYPFPVYTKSANHSQVDVAHPDTNLHPRFDQETPLQLTVGAGDALYIPEGWWHQVDSDEYTIAVNYWWEGTRSELTRDPHMTPYFGRVIMEELIKQEGAAVLNALRSSCRAAFQLHDASDISAIASEMLATTDSDRARREGMIIAVEDAARQRELQIHLASSLPVEWCALLRDASVELAALLTAFWDAAVDDDGAFQTAVFGALGEEEESIKRSLLSKREQFQRRMSLRVCQSVFGIHQPGSSGDESGP